MARLSANLDKKLIQAGKRIISRKGTKGLTIANICKNANVNIGMFNYYFKTRENYLKILYQDIKKFIDKKIKMETVIDKNPLEKLKYLITKILEFTAKHHNLSRFVYIDFAIYPSLYEKNKNKIMSPSTEILNLTAEAQKKCFLRNDIPAVEIYTNLFLRFVGTEIFKKQFLHRAHLLNFNPEVFAPCNIKDQLEHLLKHYILPIQTKGGNNV